MWFAEITPRNEGDVIRSSENLYWRGRVEVHPDEAKTYYECTFSGNIGFTFFSFFVVEAKKRLEYRA